MTARDRRGNVGSVGQHGYFLTDDLVGRDAELDARRVGTDGVAGAAGCQRSLTATAIPATITVGNRRRKLIAKAVLLVIAVGSVDLRWYTENRSFCRASLSESAGLLLGEGLTACGAIPRLSVESALAGGGSRDMIHCMALLPRQLAQAADHNSSEKMLGIRPGRLHIGRDCDPAVRSVRRRARARPRRGNGRDCEAFTFALETHRGPRRSAWNRASTSNRDAEMSITRIWLRAFVLFAAAALISPEKSVAQVTTADPWLVTINPLPTPLGVGLCMAVTMNIFNPPPGGDVPRSPTGNRITMADFDMSASGDFVAGQQVDAYHYVVCGCQGGAAGMVGTATARYPAQGLAANARVPGVAFQRTTTFVLGKRENTVNPPACLAGGSVASGAPPASSATPASRIQPPATAPIARPIAPTGRTVVPPGGTKTVLVAPTPGSTLSSGGSATFSWTATTGADGYWLDVGPTVGSGTFAAGFVNGLSKAVTGLPQDGSPVYVRLWTRIAGVWQTPIDYTFTAASSAAAVMVTPAPGSSLSGGSATFNWTAATGADGYWLDVGPSRGSGTFSAGLVNGLSKAVTGLPQNGSTIYVRLWTRIAGVWQTPIDYSYPSGP